VQSNVLTLPADHMMNLTLNFYRTRICQWGHFNPTARVTQKSTLHKQILLNTVTAVWTF